MEQEEDVLTAVGIPTIERPNPCDGVVDQAFVLRQGLVGGVGKIRE